MTYLLVLQPEADGDCVDVIAVFHAHRDPSDWQSRLSC